MPIDPKDAKSLNPRAIFSKTGKGVQEASGKTSHLSRADRAVLSAIDGKTMLSDVAAKFEKLSADKFDALIQQLDKDGFVREVSSGVQAAPTPPRPAAGKAAPKAPPPPPAGDDGEFLDFTQAISVAPKAPSAPKPPPVDLAAASRADSERKAKEQQATDYRAREEAEAKAKAEAEAKARAAAEARARAEAEAKAKAEAETSRTRAEADAKVKAAREAAVRMATEAKAKAEADAKAKTEAAERDKARLEADLNAKLEAERKAREDAERRAADAAERARKELEEKSKRDAEEMRQRLEAEMKAKLEAERKAREEEERKRRKEEDERRAKEEAERRKQREEEDRKRREEDERRRKEDEERRAKEEAERKKREADDVRRRKEDEERRAKDEAERKKQREDDERRRKEEDERRALEETNRKLETDRRAKEDAERRAKQEAEAKARAAADAAASMPKIETVAPPPAASGGGFGDSLLADLDSFGKREEEEQREKEEAERKAKAEAERRAKEEAERRAKDEAEKKRREEEERRRKEDEERRAKEEAGRREREEEERRKEEEAERKRQAKEAQAAKQAEERAAKAAAARGAARKVSGDEDDVPVTDEDLDADDLKRDQKVAAERARKVAREAQPVAVAVGTGGRSKKWGKPAAIALFALLIVGVGVLNFMPVSTAEYEKAASDAMGVPVKIASGRLSVLTGIEVKLEGVSIGGAAKIRSVRGSPEIGSLFGSRKAFSRIDLDGVQVAQAQISDALLGKVSGENFRVGRVTARQLVLDGPLKLPPLDVDATVAGDGTFQTVKLAGPEKLSVTLMPKGSDIGFEISAASIAVPFVPALNLSEFSMKGTANRSGVVSSDFDGRAFDGVVAGTARILWGDNWTVEGEVKPRNLKVAVFAPTLVSEGRVEGRAAFRMSGTAPDSLYESARVQGEFKIDKGVLGSFDVARALQTGGLQSGGRTVFNEMTGQGVYDKGAMQFTNVIISAGALNAGASLNIDANGGLSGRIVADVKTASQKQSATLNISGKVQDPVLRK